MRRNADVQSWLGATLQLIAVESVEARNLEHDRPPIPNQRKKETSIHHSTSMCSNLLESIVRNSGEQHHDSQASHAPRSGALGARAGLQACSEVLYIGWLCNISAKGAVKVKWAWSP